MKPAMPTIVHGDARALPLPDESVDLIVTSPPYWPLRSYADGGEHYDGQIGSEDTPAAFLDELIACTAEWARVLKPTGSMWVNLGDKYAANRRGPDGSSSWLSNGSQHRNTRAPWRVPGAPQKSLLLLPHRYAIRCVDDLGLICRQDQVWSKPTAMPESVTDRTRRSHEYVFHLVKQQRYYADIDEVREPHTGGSHEAGRNAAVTSWQSGEGKRHRTGRTDKALFHPKGRTPGSVWTIASQALNVPDELGIDHFAAFPMELPRRAILGWCPPDGVVLDPFGGTGTTALVATMLGRRGISVDLSADYCRLATWRAFEPKERARAAGLDPDDVAKVAAQLPGQLDLLDGAAS